MSKVGKASFDLSAVAAERRLAQAVDTVQQLKARLAEAKAEAKRLRAELAKPERHSLDCMAIREYATRGVKMELCECGIRAALADAGKGVEC